jgi:hypothetical protein
MGDVAPEGATLSSSSGLHMTNQYSNQDEKKNQSSQQGQSSGGSQQSPSQQQQSHTQQGGRDQQQGGGNQGRDNDRMTQGGAGKDDSLKTNQSQKR